MVVKEDHACVVRMAKREIRDRIVEVAIEVFWLAAAAKSDWPLVGHLLYSHGQQVCTARKPACDKCPLTSLCAEAEV